ncbi:MAG: DUF2993 domain-containing protein [Actinomycetota bacterium]|nr:DUF2993 domain-containing protein [Actinomycetota bacterium]
MSSRRAPRFPRRRRLGRWLVAIAVLAVLAVGADRATLIVAERAAASKIRSAQNLDRTPSVHIRGFPFLTQLAGQMVQQVDVTIDDFVAGGFGRTIRVAHLDAHLKRVHISGFRTARAETVTASALIDYTSLSNTLGVTVGYGGSSSDGIGRVQATQSVSVLGQQVSGTASAEVAVTAGNVLSFADPRASVDGASVPAAVVAALTRVFSAPIQLRRLPLGLVVSSFRASPAGVTVVLTGANVTYG